MNSRCLLFLLVLAFSTAAPAQLPPLNPPAAKADRAAELMKSAYLKYQKDDLNGASSDLEEAKKIVDGKRQEQAAKLFPEVEGMTANKLQREEIPLVGGTRIYRTYEGKGKTIVAEILLDSPLIDKLGALLGNPDLAAAGGQSIRRIDGFDALIKDDGNGKSELNVWIGSGILFKLSSNKAKENDLANLAKKFDLREVAKLKKAPTEKK